MPTDDRTLEEIVRRIVEGWHPDRIILFGSRARQDARPESDYDLLVIMPYEGSPHRIVGKMYRAMIGTMAAKDILLTSPDKFEWRQHVVGTIEHDAAKEGIVVYDGATQTTRI